MSAFGGKADIQRACRQKLAMPPPPAVWTNAEPNRQARAKPSKNFQAGTFVIPRRLRFWHKADINELRTNVRFRGV